MTANERPMNDRQAFDELLSNDRFDDSINEQHQNDLRSEALQAFGRSATGAPAVEPMEASNSERRGRRWNRFVGLAVILAICLMGLVAAWLYRGDTPDERNVVEEPRAPELVEDSQLVASLDEVNLFRDEVSSEALFFAIAMCELDHEGRERFESLQP